MEGRLIIAHKVPRIERMILLLVTNISNIANNEWHKNLTNVNIGIFLKIEVWEGGGVVVYSSKYCDST
jgi:hypothetical protein